MLSLFTLSLIPALAAGGLVARDNNTGSAVGNAAALANAAANLPKCAVSCTLKTAPLTKCTNPADLSCSCTDQGFQSQILACYQQSCNATELNNTLTIGAATCVAAGHPTAAPGGANTTAAANHTATSTPVTPATTPAANSSPTSDANTQVPTLCVALLTTALYALVSTTLA
ncbi:secreted protein [Melampsora americana]|nr:secreted protein [Melampsora americana]